MWKMFGEGAPPSAPATAPLALEARVRRTGMWADMERPAAPCRTGSACALTPLVAPSQPSSHTLAQADQAGQSVALHSGWQAIVQLWFLMHRIPFLLRPEEQPLRAG
jgi:hypothetical protein